MTQGQSRAGFDIDLLEGKARENTFAYIITRGRIEHKRDYRAGETGNFFLEYRQKGQPSGIAVTESDWWAIEFQHERWLFIKTDELRQLGRAAWADKAQRVNGGDFNNYEGVLIPLCWFYETERERMAREAFAA